MPVGLRNVSAESKWSKSGYRDSRSRLRAGPARVAFGRACPDLRRLAPNNENEANIAIEALLAGDLKVTDVPLCDETYGGGLVPYL